METDRVTAHRLGRGLVSGGVLLVLLVVSSLPAVAHAGPPRAADGRSTHRLEVGLAGAMFSHFPGSFGDGGPMLLVGTPLWLGVRHPAFQWVLDVQAGLGYGTHFHAGYLSVTPRVGFDLYLGPVFGLALRFGPVAMAQLGGGAVPGVGIAASGAYVLRLWPDDRRRLELTVLTEAGGYLAPDPGNDMGLNAMTLGVGLAYVAAW